jgi:hypothetical protein
MFAELMNLGVAIVAARDAVIGAGGLDLLIFQAAKGQSLIIEPGLQKTAAPPQQ